MNAVVQSKDRVVLITGGNSGLGLAMAKAFHEAGAQVAIGARRTNRNSAAVEQIGERATAFELDVSDEQSVERAINETTQRFGRLDVLVNNAGIVSRGSVMTTEKTDWDRVISVNLTGVFLCTKHAARRMAERQQGKIINIASVYGLTAPSKGLQVAYTASKHAVIGLTRANAVELAPLGVQVNAIAPGWHKTEIVDDMRGKPIDEAVRRRTPMGRWGEPGDLAGAVLFLASPASDFITGACLTVDGGYMASDGLDRG
jgi:2-deoxy-D-gluconate 3-dehydrogenase